MLSQINEFLIHEGLRSESDKMTIEEVAMGFIKVANETMCRPIRALTQVLLFFNVCSKRDREKKI